jgi:hypothetical protein
MLCPRSITVAALAVASFVVPSRVLAQRCDAPGVMLTVDRSSSMLGELPGGMTKWDAAVMAIGEITSAYEGRIDFGLQPFPYPNRCEPGEVVLDLGAHASSEIVDALGDPPPEGGNWTPMAQTLDAAVEHISLRELSRERHLVLVTDGWQWCDPYDASTRFSPVDSVTRLRDLGVTVHVIGFGAAVDPLTLNRAAVAAGTALPGCDASGTDPMEPNHCYLQANDLDELRTALGDIARLVLEEICDGDDDDCDGEIDEGYDTDEDGATTCGGDCDDGDESRYAGAYEHCDGIDNDCDGTTDPDCGCTTGAEMECGSDVGECATGVQTCAEGTWGACEAAVGESSERCNGLDDDCDGEIDDDADSACATGQACSSGACIDLRPPMPMDPEPTDPTEDPMTPPDEERPSMRRRAGTQGGCGCTAAGAEGDLDPSMPLALITFFLVIAYLRRRAQV